VTTAIAASEIAADGGHILTLEHELT